MTRDRTNDRPKSAAELMRELQQDPEYVARTRQKERERLAAIDRHQQSAEPLMRELQAIGLTVTSLGELRSSGVEYRDAIPILARWLTQATDVSLKEDIVRTLSVPWGQPATPAMLREFRSGSATDGLRWAIANALAVVADDATFEAIARLAQDKSYGRSREMLALALGNMHDARAISVLLALLDDEDTVGHAVMALGKLRAVQARSRLEGLTRHPVEWIREEAKKALANM